MELCHSELFQERPMEDSRYARTDIYWESINGISNKFRIPLNCLL